MKARGDHFISVYITVPTESEAKKIANILLKEHLAACVTLIPTVTSFYRWKGKIEKSHEVILLAKTKARLFKLLTKRVCALHSYKCPCILALPIGDGYAPYLTWLETETQKGARTS